MFFEGIHPPVPRSETDFDPAAKYHIANNVAYIRYFLAKILIFQFHETLCRQIHENELKIHEKESKIENESIPLHKCTIYNSLEAGDQLWKMLKLGRSKPWPEILENFLQNSNDFSAEPMLKFFQPLYEFLKKENEKNQDCVGWDGNWLDYPDQSVVCFKSGADQILFFKFIFFISILFCLKFF